MKTYELTLTPNYVSDWDFNMAMRELIQNGTDQEILDKNNVFSISYEDGKILLHNTKSVLKINTLLLGRSTKSKNEDTVGQFGEGYKIAALVLNRIGKSFTVHNHSKNEIWTTRFVNSRRWHDRILVFDVDEKPSEQQGLTIEVGNVSEEEWEKLQSVWLGFIHDCNKVHTTYGDILTDESQKNSVYVNGLFISCSANLQYGYDFKPQYLKLERDRMSCDSFNARDITSKMLNEAYENGDIDPADLQYGYDFKPQYLKLERDRMSCDSFNARDITSKMLNEAYENGDIDPAAVHEMIEDGNDDISFISYEAGYSMEQGYLKEFDDKNQMESFDDEEIPETLAKPIPVVCQVDYNYAASLGGNPIYVNRFQGDILANVRKERLKELTDYASTHNEEMTVYDRLNLWHKRYRNYLTTEATEEFEKIIELLK